MQATVSSHGPHFASMTHINERHDFGWFYTPMSKVVHQLENGTASMWDVLEISRYCVVASQIFAMLTEKATSVLIGTLHPHRPFAKPRCNL